MAKRKRTQLPRRGPEARPQVRSSASVMMGGRYYDVQRPTALASHRLGRRERGRGMGMGIERWERCRPALAPPSPY